MAPYWQTRYWRRPYRQDGEETGFYDGELEKLFEQPEEKENLEDVGTR